MLLDEKKIDLLKLHVCKSIMDFYFIHIKKSQ